MKIPPSFCFFILCSSLPALAQGQSATNVPPSTPYTVVSRDANSQVWERTTYETSPSGQVITRKHHYTELATGLNFKDPATGQWVPAKEEIDILPDGTAAATKGQHQAYFPADINNGVITLVTPEGRQFKSQPAGLFYDDGTNTVLIAGLTNSTGQLVADNQVIYKNAFAGLPADLLYTYTKAGFEQDVILEQRPPNPEAYGLNPETTRLQLVTEFFDAPEPKITSRTLPRQAGVALADDLLDFGAMKMVQDRAFSLGANDQRGPAMAGKQWLKVGGRQFLAEEVPVAAVQDQLAGLPMAQNAGSKPNSPLNVVLRKGLMPPPRPAKSQDAPAMKIARGDFLKHGLLLDYQMINGNETNVTFQGDTTYYISGNLDLFGTNTFEGGAVIKYTNGVTIAVNITGPDALVWNASAYRPVVFTAKDDNSVGDTISGSTGSPSGQYYAAPALTIVGGTTPALISYFRVAYAEQAFELIPFSSPQFYNGQIVDCQDGFEGNFISGETCYLRNILFANVETNFYNLSDVYVSYDVQNSTFSSSTYLSAGVAPTFCFTNCVFANVLSVSNNSPAGNDNGFYNTPVFGSGTVTNSAYPFQTVGGGGYYLTNGCAFRGAGTTNIDPVLVAYLAQKTTWPPTVYDQTNVSSLGTLGLAAARDTNSAPDLGYHYDALDYVFGGSDLYGNLTFTNGAAVGWFEDSGSAYSSYQPYGISLNGGANLSFNGSATQPCFFVWYGNVQEAENGNWTDQGYMASLMFNGGSPAPLLSANFTKLTCDPSHGGNFRDNWNTGSANFQNCEFYNGGASTYDMQWLGYTNCLFFRESFAFWDQDYAVSFAFINCTFYNGCLDYNRYNCDPFCDSGLSSSFWQIENCAFDGTAFAWYDTLNENPSNTLINYNAYNTNNLSWTNYPFPYPPTFGTNEVVGPNDVMVGNYNWESSWLGNFYLPTNSAVIAAGSTNANLLGLYWYTTQTNQAVEGTNIVDIGYHYVATDAHGNPLEYVPSTGIPNYLLYPNGPPTNLLEITSEPTNQVVKQGSNTTFSVTAVTVPSLGYPLVYQWFGDGLPLANGGGISGSTSATLGLTNVNSAQVGVYEVVVSDGFASVTSTPAMLTVLPLQTNMPATNWVATGAMTTTRVNHTETLLANGQVLAAGGSGLYVNYLATAEVYNPASATWTQTGSMNNAREYHTATLLTNGLVLVAGGDNGSAMTSAELYNPVTGTWTNTGSLTYARYAHTATLLTNGEVLVAGGYNGSTVLTSAEIYNPATGTWSVTGSLNTGRLEYSAVLLTNGLVLAAGGVTLVSGVETELSSAERYNPGSGTWTTTASMNNARADYGMQMLTNGIVLVAGGVNGSGVISNAELYYTKTGTWTNTGSMTTPRYYQTATRLTNGLVMTAGGYDNNSDILGSSELYNPSSGTWALSGTMKLGVVYQTAVLLTNGQVLVAGGIANPGGTGYCELYNYPPVSNWTMTGSMNSARSAHTATLLTNGLVLVAGGDSGSNAELYVYSTGSWTNTGPMNAARYNHTATLLPNGQVLAAGGGSALASAELYNPATENWVPTGSMTYGRGEGCAVLLPNGLVLVAGGYGTNGALSSAELYNPATGTWTLTGSMSTARYYFTLTLLPNGLVLAAGGPGATAPLTSSELYNPATGTWTATGSMNTGRELHTATLLPNGLVLVAGGLGPSPPGAIISAELYNPATGTWAYTGSMNNSRYWHCATLVASGQVLVAGGEGSSGNGYLNSAEFYNPTNGIWTATGSMNIERNAPKAALLTNGVVLVTGGVDQNDNILSSAEIDAW